MRKSLFLLFLWVLNRILGTKGGLPGEPFPFPFYGISSFFLRLWEVQPFASSLRLKFPPEKSFFLWYFLPFWYTILGVCSINTFLVLQNFFLIRLYKILNINISKTNRVLRLSLKFNLRAEKEFFKLKKLFLSFRNRLFLMVQKKSSRLGNNHK